MLKKHLFASSTSSAPTNGTLIMYENDGTPILCILKDLRKQKYLVLNDRGRELELDTKRAYILSATPLKQATSTEEQVATLKKINQQANEFANHVQLAEVWELLVADAREVRVSELAALCFGDAKCTGPDSAAYMFALWLALLGDRIYFKRNKDSFTPRNVDTVTALKLEKQRAIEREQLQVLILKELSNIQNGIEKLSPATERALLILKQLAAGYDFNEGELKEARELAEVAAKQFLPGFSGRPEDGALAVLDHLKIFNARTNLYLIRHAINVPFQEIELKEAERVKLSMTDRLDLTALETFTVDDASTMDMDDALSWHAHGHGYQLGIHISDVSSYIEPNSVLEHTALARATSMYFPDGVIPMLPESLSHNALSIRVGEKRAALSYLIEYSSSLELVAWRLVPSYVKSRRRLTYEDLDQLLEHSDQVMTLLSEVAQYHESERIENGAARINKHDAQVKINDDGTLQLVQIDEHSPARNLVAEMMVLANKLSAEFAIEKGAALVFRAQEPATEELENLNLPEGPAKDYAVRSKLKRSVISSSPAMHATLGLKAYAQLTSPIRRAHDLINQRQLISLLKNGHPFYSAEQINGLIQHCEHALARATAVARESKRFWLLKYLEQQRALGEVTLSGIVTRNDLKNPIVEIENVHLPLPVKFNAAVKVGSRVNARIAALDARREIVRLEGLS